MKRPVGKSPVTWEFAETGNIKRAIRASSKLRNRCWVADYTNSYVEALILGTPKVERAKPAAIRQREGFSSETIAQMEQEMVTLERNLKAIESSYGENRLNLTLARACVRELLNRPTAARHLSAFCAGNPAEFTTLPEINSFLAEQLPA
jgi:hypothetical protein